MLYIYLPSFLVFLGLHLFLEDLCDPADELKQYKICQHRFKTHQYVQPVFSVQVHSPLALEIPECQAVHAHICKKLFQLLDRSLHTLHTAMDRKVRQSTHTNRGSETTLNGS